jgi:CheY-like chemotaxis protein
MPQHILVVDDNTDNLDLVSKILRLDGYEVITAGSGQDALLQVGSLTPDLVILDMMMPNMDGMELCRQLRQLPDCARIPIIMLSAFSDPKDTRDAKIAGANTLIGKPFDLEALGKKVRTLLKKQK